MSTRGMRSILKDRPSPLKHMENKMAGGLYDSDTFPSSYDILSHHPPIPTPPGVLSDLKTHRKLLRAKLSRIRRRNRRRMLGYDECAFAIRDDDVGYDEDANEKLQVEGEIVLPTDKWVKEYLKRHPYGTKYNQEEPRSMYEHRAGVGDIDGYYQHGGDRGTVEGGPSFAKWGYLDKSTQLTDAFVFAMHQHEYLMKHAHKVQKNTPANKHNFAAYSVSEVMSQGTERPIMTQQELEEESVKEIEALLHKERQKERFRSRQVAREMHRDQVHQQQQRGKNREFVKAAAQAAMISKRTSLPHESPPSKLSPDQQPIEDKQEEETKEAGQNLEHNPSIFHNNPRAALEMSLWGDRLSSVPYSHWTLGAMTALDHWLATTVLQMSERTWQRDVLEGRSKSLQRDVDMVRGALFPETMDGDVLGLGVQEEQEDDAAGLEERMGEDRDETERSIDELLASLGVEEDSNQNMDGTSKTAVEREEQRRKETPQERNDRLAKELHEWQGKNHALPFEEWSADQQEEFNEWLSNYVQALAPNQSPTDIDLDQTRMAMFAEPYLSSETQDELWSSLQDETDAEMLLQDILTNAEDYLADLDQEEEGDGAAAAEGLREFLQLTYDEQLERLQSVGAMRPLYQETTAGGKSTTKQEKEMEEFVTSHVESLRQGVTVDNVLTPNLKGSVTAKELYGLEVDDHRFAFREEELGVEAVGGVGKEKERDVALYRAWRRYRANIANRQEYLFQEGRMGLEREDGKGKKKKKEGEGGKGKGKGRSR